MESTEQDSPADEHPTDIVRPKRAKHSRTKPTQAPPRDYAHQPSRNLSGALNGTDEWRTTNVDENHAYKPSTCQSFSAGVEDTADMIFPAVTGHHNAQALMQTQNHAGGLPRRMPASTA
jgi:hypothetical protein